MSDAYQVSAKSIQMAMRYSGFTVTTGTVTVYCTVLQEPGS